MRLTRSFPTSLTVLTWNVYLTVFAQGCCFIMCAVGIGKAAFAVSQSHLVDCVGLEDLFRATDYRRQSLCSQYDSSL